MLVSLVPAYGCLGFLSIFGGEGGARFGGLTTPGEMYALTVYFGEFVIRTEILVNSLTVHQVYCMEHSRDMLVRFMQNSSLPATKHVGKSTDHEVHLHKLN